MSSSHFRASTAEAEAIRTARFTCHLDSPAQLLRAALAGDEDALKALREAWPAEAINAWSEVVTLGKEAQTAVQALDAKDLRRIAGAVAKLKKKNPKPPCRPTRSKVITAPAKVIQQLVGLAKNGRRVGPGRSSAADGIRIMLNHQEAPDA